MRTPELRSLAEQIAALEPRLRDRVVASLTPAQSKYVRYVWAIWERQKQSEPDLPWRTWLVLAGRGFGKTRMGAEWVRRMAKADGRNRIAMVGATLAEARAVMVEGPSGILAVCPEDERPVWEPSLGRLRFPGGARAQIYSAAEPDSLRGPQHHFAWCDEIAKWPFGPAAWDNLMFGLRCGALPRAVATTTPRPVALVRRLYTQAGVVRTGGRTADNAANLAGAFLTDVERDYGGTRLGRQELDGELIEDVEGSLWPRELIERRRVSPSLLQGEGLKRIVVGVDPPVTEDGDACGIVVCALGEDGNAYVLADATVAGLSPDAWAKRVAWAAEAWGADRVVAESNQGGALVTSVLRAADIGLPVRLVHAWQGKAARAEPVAALFERGAARFAGAFPALEDELAGLTYGGGYQGPGRSPDRADAMVYAMTELMLGRRRAEPRIRRL
ncbi:MAG: terminase family protein [Allosphingosinicella sp.]